MLSIELSCFDTRSKASKLVGASLNACTHASILRKKLRHREGKRGERDRGFTSFPPT